MCRNKTFWEDRPCPGGSVRCNGSWPGQCPGVAGCRDLSDRDNTQNVANTMCLVKGKMVNITQDMKVCGDKYNPGYKIGYKMCDAVKDGCQDDMDESGFNSITVRHFYSSLHRTNWDYCSGAALNPLSRMVYQFIFIPTN